MGVSKSPNDPTERKRSGRRLWRLLEDGVVETRDMKTKECKAGDGKDLWDLENVKHIIVVHIASFLILYLVYF